LGLMLPLWRIKMEAPQYPHGLEVDIYAYTIQGGHDGNDLREINILNHYIGMKRIERAELTDLDWLPFGFGLLGVLLLRLAAVGTVRRLMVLSVLAASFPGFPLGLFAYKLYSSGHTLSPEPPVKRDPFMPGLLGTKHLENFTTPPGPAVGTYLIGV